MRRKVSLNLSDMAINHQPDTPFKERFSKAWRSPVVNKVGLVLLENLVSDFI